ncbi:MAG: DUF2326 domain-containing protein [Acidobacteria bacterium]|nr:DUF2326 domain-containing protein [Acidobacteriota bacterium]
MLVEIRSNKFRTGSVSFGPGLNVILGDENATNSIGKSTLLMIIDFALGGDSLIEHNRDLVPELGEHDYYFVFQFEGESYRFRRGTAEPNLTYYCNEQFEPERFMSLDEYTALLKRLYGIDIPHLTFRSLVGLYARVWGKKNLNVARPLHVVPEQKSRDCVDTLLKVFERYETIHALTEALTAAEAKEKALRAAQKQSIVKSIGKRQHATNQERIAVLESDLADIRDNLAKYATSLSAVINKEVLALKRDRDQLLESRLTIESRLQRVRRNLAENRSIRKGSFAELVHYFPVIDADRLERVEEFHNDVARLLREELAQSAKQLEQQLAQIDSAMREVDAGMALTLSSVDDPGGLVDRVVGLSRELIVAQQENDHFESQNMIRAEVSNLSDTLDEEKEKILAVVQAAVNDAMARIVRSSFGDDRKSPHLTLRESNYSFEVNDDTGTGVAYVGLVLFDLAVFLSTKLPVVVHDTLLFKNIENHSVAHLVNIYQSVQKQSFVALDEIYKYGEVTAELLRSKSVIQLDDNNVLYIKDWRKKKQPA